MTSDISNSDISSIIKCRTCLAQTQVMIPMTCLSIASGNKLKISEVFMMCASIQIDPDDGFSQFACSECVISAEKAYTFRKQCEKVDNIWHSMLQTQVKEEVYDDAASAENELEPEQVEVLLVKQEAEINMEMENLDFGAQKKRGRPAATDPSEIRKLNFQCVECGRWYREVEGLQAHVRLYHRAGGTPRTKAKATLKLLQHFSRICETCKEEVSTEDCTHTHDNAVGGFLYRCKECTNEFKEKQDARVHWRFRHGEKAKRTVISYPKQCLFCPAMINSFKDNEKHVDEEHADLKRYVCDICGKSFLREGYLKIHKDIHAGKKNYICQYCGRGFTNSVNLANHVRLHTGEKPYVCDICGAKYAQSASLRSHKYGHLTEKLFECDLCHVRFRRQNTLTLHRRRHSGTKPYECDVCLKRFTTSSSRKKHMLTHTGERNFVCPTCGKAFSRGSHLKVHKQVHTGEKPHLCSECGRGFSQAHCLRSHMKSIHHKEVHVESNTVPIINVE